MPTDRHGHVICMGDNVLVVLHCSCGYFMSNFTIVLLHCVFTYSPDTPDS